MIQILYAKDHEERGRTLGQATPGSHWGLTTERPIHRQGLDTLLFWGHGTISSLCDLSAQQVAGIVKEWKKHNAGLKTVEVITCNSRHAPKGHDSFVAKLKAELRAGILSSTRNIVIKALPVNVGGSLNAYSILLAHAPTKSWCYITAPQDPTASSSAQDRIMMQGSADIKNMAKRAQWKSASPGMPETPFYGLTGNHDIAAAAGVVAKGAWDRKYTLNYGYFNTLRAQLVPVH